MGAREAKKWQLARPRGFEPLAPRFVAWCSVQLSYGRVNVALSWNCVEASILCGFSTMRLGRDTRGYQTAGEAWESARQEFEAATRPQERSCTRERSETCPKGPHRMCAVQSALIRGLGTSFSLNMTGTLKQELKMHAQAEPERPKGEGRCVGAAIIAAGRQRNASSLGMDGPSSIRLK